MAILPLKPLVIPPVGVPPPGPTERDITIEGWEEKAAEHMELAQQGEQQIRDLVTEFEALQKRHLQPPWLPDWLKGLPAGITLMGPFGPRAELASFKPRIQQVEFAVERDDFYTRLYSQVPFVIASGRSADPEDILQVLKPPPNMTPAELDEVSDTILSMVELLVGEVPTAPEGYPTPEQLDAMTPERRAEVMKLMAVTPPGEVPELPELVVPTEVTGTPTAIHKLTKEAIIRSLTAPKVPPSVMSEEEWADFMVESGQISSKADLEQVEYFEDTADAIIDEWQERNNMLASYRDAVAEMPDYELIDLAKEAVIQPGLALLTIAGAYFEHVSMPLAGAVYKTFIPDIEVEYQRLKKTEGTWTALSHAWESWDPELWFFDDSAAEWIMKYMLMEGLVDPLTYVGWGIATRLTKPLGPVGRMVGSVERGFASVMEVPFDLIKTGIRKLPRTPAQLATISMHKTGQYVDKFLTMRYGKALYQMTMKEWDEGVKFATKYTLSHPQIDNEITRAGRELLKHVPVTEKEALSWAERLGSTLTPQDITRNTIDSLDMVFETWFTHTGGKNKLMPTQEAADEMVRVLFGKQTPESSVIAGKILNQRGSQIIADTMSFSGSQTTFKAIRSLMQRNYKFQIKTMDSYAALARKQMGSVATMLDDIPIRIQKAWQNGIDKWIVRPFAESYLTFAMYGPMNIIEDVIRTGLGGVKPGRKAPQAFARKWAGTSYDVDLMRDAVSETYGYLRSRPQGELNNWILQLGGLAKGFGDWIYGQAVRRPGQVGIGMRRNFVDGKATQVLKDLGGDTFERLANVGPARLSGVTNKRITKEVQQVATELKIQGSPEAIRAAKDDFTRANVVRREVDQILTEHPDLPRPVRDFVMRQYDDDVMFREAGSSIDGVIRDADNVMLDDFITSPERASTQFEQLSDMLTRLEVRNPEEMAHLIQSLNTMSSIYGASPKQILGRAVERTRGLPFAERRLSIDKALDDITIFRERAGASMDKLMERIKVQMSTVYPDNPQYVSKAEQLFNLQTAKRIRGSELGEEISAWRHQFFADADPKALHTQEFWDDFDRQVIGRHHAANVEMADFDGQIKAAIDDLDIAGGLKPRQRPALKIVDRELAPNDVAQLIGARGDDISRSLLDVMTAQNDKDMFVSYVMAHVKPDDVGFSKESVGAVYNQIADSLRVPPESMSWLSGRRIELEAVRRDFHALYNSKLLPDEEIANIGKYLDGTADAVEKEMFTQVPVPGKPIPVRVTSGEIWDSMSVANRRMWLRQARLPERLGGKPWKNLVEADHTAIIGARADIQAVPPTFERGKLKSEFAGYNDLRQQAMDEAHKWYYKEFTDYSNANAFDSFLKAIYPFWTYESQRWFWLPRSFVRHPGTFTAFERWQNNTDYGYLHIPGTSVDVGLGRGTVYGTLQTRLTRRDYPEYYDSLGAAGDVIEFSDFLSRYGFYPGAHIGIPLAMFGGVEMQMGEAMPAFVKTPLDALIALYPDNESVKWISERLFGDRFRNYMTILTVNKLGGDGTLIFTKEKEGVALTPEEEQIWTDARREVGWYAAGFEQFGLFRFRTDEQHKMYEEASKVIEEMTGYTSDQQDWLRKHGYRLWDMVGGMSPTEQAILQEMDYYRWVGNIRPLLPGKQQEILNQIELGWNAVDKYSETVQTGKLQIQADLLTGARGPDDYNKSLLELYDDQRKFIDAKIEEIPLMSLENRAEYYKTYKIPQPVLHPMRELLNLYFSIELTEVVDPETGEIVRDWDNFWAQRQAIEDAIPEDLKPEWEDFLGRNSTRMEETRREVYHNYFRTYNKVWEKILTTYPEDEQAMIEEYLHLERTGKDLERQAEIKATPSQKTGNMLISSFRSEVSGAKEALRYANPTLDAWLFYWGKTSTFTSPTGEEVYRELANITGRVI